MAEIKDNLTQNLSIQTDSLFDANTGTGPGPIKFDDSQLVTVDSIKKEIVDYIRLRLGDGMIDIEADKEHFDMGVKQALMRYQQRAQNSTEESYAFLDIYPETQEYILPREIQNVRQVYRRGIGSVTGTTASQFEPFASGYLNTYMLVAGRVGGLVNYEAFTGYQELAMRMFGGWIHYTFNRTTKKLTFTRRIPFFGQNYEEQISESVLLHVDNERPDVSLLNDTHAYPWIQDYALAFVMIAIGNAREKFASIAGPQGGTTLNGAQLKSEGNDLLMRLDEDIKNYVDGSSPLYFVIG